MKFTVKIMLISMLAGYVGFADSIYEDFEGYSDGQGITDYYWYGDSTGSTAYGVNVSDLGSTKAAWFTVADADLNPGDWVYFETWNQIQDGPAQDWMQLDLSIVVNDLVADANPDNPSLINEVWYYMYADTNNDGTDDAYFETRVTGADDADTPLDSPDILQPYGKQYMGGSDPDTWDQYDPDTFAYLGTSTGLSDGFLESLSAVGVQLRTDNFDTAGESDFITVWGDNFMVIPEPSTIIMLIASLAVFSLRGRRRRRSCS